MSIVKAVSFVAVVASSALAISPVQALEKIRFGLNWVPEAEHCGFFYAKATGLYEQAGLDVDISYGGPGTNVGLLLAGGELDLAMGSSFTTLNMVNQGIPGVTIAAFFQKDPQTLVAHPGQAVTTLEDVKGKPVMVADFARGEFWQFLKVRMGFSDEQLRPYTFSNAVFLSDPTSVQQGYVTSDKHYLGAELPEPPVVMLLADYGYANYATTVFGMRSYVDANAGIVKSFIAATAAGYEACMTGDYTPAMTLATTMNTDPAYGPGLWAAAIEEMKTRGIVMGGDAEAGGIGTMTDERWKTFFNDMVTAGVYPAELDYKQAFSLQFVTPKP